MKTYIIKAKEQIIPQNLGHHIICIIAGAHMVLKRTGKQANAKFFDPNGKFMIFHCDDEQFVSDLKIDLSNYNLVIEEES